MGLKGRFMRTTKSENGTEANPVAEDILWGTLAMLAFTLAQMASGIIHWWGWYLLAAGGMSVCLVREALRFQIQLLPHYKSARRLSLLIICFPLTFCILEIIGMFLWNNFN